VQKIVFRCALFALVVALSLVSGSANGEVNLRSVYVSSSDNFIYEVDLRTGGVRVFADENDGIDRPSALAFDPRGNLLVSSFETDEIYSFSGPHEGAVVLDARDGIHTPFGENGMTFDEEGNLYVSSFLGREILMFPADRSEGMVFASAVDGIETPRGLALDSEGNLLVANNDDENILKFDRDGVGGVFADVNCVAITIDVHSNGDVFYGCENGDVFRWYGGDPAVETFLGDYGGFFANHSIALSADELELFMTTDQGGELLTIDPESGRNTVLIPSPELVNGNSIGVYRVVPEIAFFGECPGTLNVEVSGATPNGGIAVIRGDELGESLVPGGPCIDARLPLDSAQLVNVIRADANGAKQATVTLDADDCSGFVAVVDVRSCIAGPPTALTP